MFQLFYQYIFDIIFLFCESPVMVVLSFTVIFMLLMYILHLLEVH